MELDRITITRELDEDDSSPVVVVDTSDDISFYDALAMMAVAHDTILRGFDEE